MWIKRLIAGLLIASVAAPGNCFAQAKPLEMKWSELAPMVTGQHASLTLSDGTAVKGEAVAVRDDAILMYVSRGVKGYPKGSGAVPRSSIVLIDVQQTKGDWGRIMGTVIGVVGGISISVYTIDKILFHVSGGGATGIFAGTVATGSLAGYFIGRVIDRRVVHIRIIP